MLLYTSNFKIALRNFAISNLCNSIWKLCKLGCTIWKLHKLACAIFNLRAQFQNWVNLLVARNIYAIALPDDLNGVQLDWVKSENTIWISTCVQSVASKLNQACNPRVLSSLGVAWLFMPHQEYAPRSQRSIQMRTCPLMGNHFVAIHVGCQL